MKATVFNRYGGPEVLSIREISELSPGPRDVVVEVRAAALNHLDVWVRRGRPGMKITMPHVPGSDASGVVAEVGAEAGSVKIGDEVIINPSFFCGKCEFCLRGEQSECVTFGILGMSAPGTFAQKVVVPAKNVYPKPRHLDFIAAAALPLSHQTAWRMLMSRAVLRCGETVLIHGIGGGVALAALQIANQAGACIIATSSSDEKLGRAAKMGADHTINYKTSDVVARVREITGGRGVDVSFNAVGASAWPIDFEVLRKGGRIVICGVTTGAEVSTNLSQLYSRQIAIFGSTMGSSEDFRLMLKTVDENKLAPVVDSIYSLYDVVAASEKMEAGQQFGKIILSVS